MLSAIASGGVTAGFLLDFDAATQLLVANIGSQIGDYRETGRTREAADDFATFAVAGVEGAIVLCRAQRSIEPFDRVARQLQAMVASA